MGRSGSKYLRSLINQHPDIADYGEAFHNRAQHFPEGQDPRVKLTTMLLSPESLVGFQYRYPRHPQEFPEIIEVLEENQKNIRIIFLERKNKIKGAISQQNCEKLKRETGHTHFYKHLNQKQEPLELDIDRAVKEALERERLDAQFGAWAERFFETLHITYEDLCIDAATELSRVFDFLDVPRLKNTDSLQSNFVKVMPNRLQDAVLNYSSLETAIKTINRDHWLDNFTVKPKRRTIHPRQEQLFEDAREVADLNCRLIASQYAYAAAPYFFEHIPAFKTNGGDMGRVITQKSTEILQSDDLGISWQGYDIERTYDRCFTLASGTHLLQNNSGTISRFDQEWRHLGDVETGLFPWHGSWSIDENVSNRTVIWAEYPYAAPWIKVWRSVDDGKTWQIVFKQKGQSLNPAGGEVRHFHTCQHCTTKKGRWYLSSGDTENQSKLWISEDDGATWAEIRLSTIDGMPDSIPQHLHGRLLRFTSLIQTETHLIYPTDDTFRGHGALVVALEKADPSNATVFAGDCGQNEVRNIVRVSDRYALAFSESKVDLTQVHVSLVDLEQFEVHPLTRIENTSRLKSNFMNSISSTTSEHGVFFSYSDNTIFNPQGNTRFLRWDVNLVGM